MKCRWPNPVMRFRPLGIASAPSGPPFAKTAKGRPPRMSHYYHSEVIFNTGYFMASEKPAAMHAPPAIIPSALVDSSCIRLGTFGTWIATALKYWASKTGVSYLAGVDANVTKGTKAVGVNIDGQAYLAADPQGNVGLVRAFAPTAVVGGSSRGAGLIIGSATFQSIDGFGDYSKTQFSAQVSGKGTVSFATGFNLSSNSSGVQTTAFVGMGHGSRFGGAKNGGLSYAVITPVCHE